MEVAAGEVEAAVVAVVDLVVAAVVVALGPKNHHFSLLTRHYRNSACSIARKNDQRQVGIQNIFWIR